MVRVFRVSQNSYIFALDFPPKQIRMVVSSLKKRVLENFFEKSCEKICKLKKCSYLCISKRSNADVAQLARAADL